MWFQALPILQASAACELALIAQGITHHRLLAAQLFVRTVGVPQTLDEQVRQLGLTLSQQNQLLVGGDGAVGGGDHGVGGGDHGVEPVPFSPVSVETAFGCRFFRQLKRCRA